MHEPSHGALSLNMTPPSRPPLDAGLHWLDAPTRPALLHVPDRLPPWPVPLLVAFHDGHGTPDDIFALLSRAAASYGALVLAPACEGFTWDAIADGCFGPDVLALRHVVSTVRDRFNVDPDRVAIAGFGDGASYALGLGLANGDLFTRVLAYSPGHVPSVHRRGRPTVFVSHGRNDAVRPIARTSHRIISALEDDGYHVDYVEHDHGHEVPDDVVAVSAELLG